MQKAAPPAAHVGDHTNEKGAGESPVRQLAYTIRGLVGLNTRQAGAVLSYRQSLADEGFSLERMNKLVASYAGRQLRSRARTIARTETSTVMIAGNLEAWRREQADGWLGPSAKKTVVPGCGGHAWGVREMRGLGPRRRAVTRDLRV